MRWHWWLGVALVVAGVLVANRGPQPIYEVAVDPWSTFVASLGFGVAAGGILFDRWRRSRTPQPRTPLPSGNRAPVATSNRDGTV